MPLARTRLLLATLAAGAALLAAACKSDDTSPAPTTPGGLVEGQCVIPAGDTSTEFLKRIDCTADFRALASEPIDATIPGARSGKVVLDTTDGNALYFQNSNKYKIHYEFASSHLSGNGKPTVGTLAEFNTTEYYSPDRRFVLGAVTYYEGPKVWAVEISPYDTASAKMMETLFRGIAAASFFGPALRFHPTSDAVAVEAKSLPSDIPIVTTDELFAGIDYQPLSLATGVGRLRFFSTATLDTADVSYQDIVVLDSVPNDISAVQGIISEGFQTPLSHVNVLSQNRKTPNMGLRNATKNATLRALEGKLVELTVAATEWKVREVSQAEAEAYWAAHKPAPVVLPAIDTSVTGLRDIEEVTPEPTAGQTLRDNLKKAVTVYGGKAAHYSVLRRTPNVPIKPAFAVPVYYYDKFMRDNGLYAMLDGFLADPSFASDSKVRVAKLTTLRDAMLKGKLADDLMFELKLKILAQYPNHKIRFRTSTNSEDLEGFPCAGCYDSHSGDPTKDWNTVWDAIRVTWSTAWTFRTFEERAYYGVDHKSVAMALLVHENFPQEEANGVAVTNNPYSPSGLEPAFYVNVQTGGDVEVVAPPAGTTSDQFLYFFDVPNQPITYLAHSNLIPKGTTVLSGLQIRQLGLALEAIHDRFSPAYGPAAGKTGWYAMDVEFKFDNDANPSAAPTLYVKQARPYPGRGQ